MSQHYTFLELQTLQRQGLFEGELPKKRYTKADRLQEENLSLKKRVQELQQRSAVREGKIDIANNACWEFARSLSEGIYAFIRWVVEIADDQDIAATRFKLLELE